MTDIIGADSKMLIQEVVEQYGILRTAVMKAPKAGGIQIYNWGGGNVECNED